MIKKFLLFAVVCNFLLASCATSQSQNQNLPVEKFDWQAAPDLKPTDIGRPVPVVVVQNLNLLKIPGREGFEQVLAFKETRDSNTLHFVTFNTQTGEVKKHPPMPGYEVLRQVAVKDKLYLGINLPAHLLEYDLATDTLKDLGVAFDLKAGPASALFCFGVGPDGTLALGGTGSSQAALYNPQTGEFARYGRVGEGYIYTIGQDENYIYAADRGNKWQLIVIDKRTGKHSAVMTVPEPGYIQINGDKASVRPAKDAPWEYYKFVNGQPVKTQQEEAKATLQPALNAPRPEVFVDTDEIFKTGKLPIYWRNPQDKPAQETPDATPAQNGWKRAEIEVPLDTSIPLHRFVLTDDGRLVGTQLSYGGLFSYDTKTGEFKMLGRFEPISIIGVAQKDNTVYVSGYPGASFAKVDLSRPFTTPVSKPGQPGIPWKDPRANPWLADQLGEVLESAHETAAMEFGSDGRVYLTGMRFRYNKGFSLGWFDPRTNTSGKVEDAGLLDQFQVVWMAKLNGGQQFAISTYVQPDESKNAPEPDAAQVFVYDVAEGKFTNHFAPLPEAKKLGPIAALPDGTLLGSSVQQDDNPTTGQATTLYIADPETGRVLRQRKYEGVIAGLPAKTDIPRKGHDFQTGPDGFVWSVYRLPYADAPALIIRIDPKDLSIHPVGKVPGGSVRFQFVGRDLYLTGAPQLRVLKNVVPAT